MQRDVERDFSKRDVEIFKERHGDVQRDIETWKERQVQKLNKNFVTKASFFRFTTEVPSIMALIGNALHISV